MKDIDITTNNLRFISTTEPEEINTKSAYLPDFLLVLANDRTVISYYCFEKDNPLYPGEDIIPGTYIYDVFNPALSIEIIKGIKKAKEKRAVIDLEHVLPINFTNRIINVRYVPSPDDNTTLLIRDITKLKRAEEALLQSELRFRSVWENSIDGMRLVDMNGNILAANKAYSELVGLNSAGYVGQPFSIVYADYGDTDIVIQEFRKNFASRNISRFFEKELHFRSGKSLDVEVFNVFIESSQEKALEGEVLLLTIFRDITERKKSETALRNSELRFRSVWENSVDGMRLTDAEGNIVAVNNSFCSLTGFTKEELIGKPYSDIYTGKNEEEKTESLNSYKEHFKDKKFRVTRQSRSAFRSGKVLDIEVTYSLIEYKTGEPLLLAIFHDVTERNRAEEELRKTETLAAIGKMAAYLSHEIKTPLASIKMNIDLLARDPALNQGKQRSLTIIQKEVKRLNKLLRNVLQYSKTHELHIVSINMEVMINGLKELLDVQLKEKNIELINNLREIKINGDYQRLQSVFMHLLENSMEAIENKGTIELYADENIEDDSTTVFIKDSGSGVKLGKEIFEPFFTTKHTGTGLGLAIAQRIVEQHNGDLSLYSSSPGETIFAIRFFNFGI
jgi:PAS domain S-box-containing protein